MAAAVPLLIDGSFLEGGGQLLRNAMALSALCSRPILVEKIRNNRFPPGLKPQHATGLRLVSDICSGNLKGCQRESKAIEFHPGPITLSRPYTADPGTAGSITLLLQVALPTLLFTPPAPESASPPAPTVLILRGGTNALAAPQVDYTAHVFLTFLARRFGVHPALEIRTRGFFPRGGGEARVTVTPRSTPLPPVLLTRRGPVASVGGRVYVVGMPARAAHAMRDAAVAALVQIGVDPGIISIEAVREHDKEALGSIGSGIVLWAETEEGCVLGGSALGSKYVTPEVIAGQAVDQLARNLVHGGCVDEYMQDQMIIFLALAQGRSTVKTGPLTSHTKTAIWIAEQLTGAKFNIGPDIAEPTTTIIHCDGVGYTASPQILAGSFAEPAS